MTFFEGFHTSWPSKISKTQRVEFVLDWMENIAVVVSILILDAIFLTSSHRSAIEESLVNPLPKMVTIATLPAVSTVGKMARTLAVSAHSTEASNDNGKLSGIES